MKTKIVINNVTKDNKQQCQSLNPNFYKVLTLANDF